VLTAPHVPWLFPLWGIRFIVMGAFLAAGRFALDSYVRSLTFYAITDRRVLIARAAPWPKLVSLRLDQLPPLHMATDRRGRGTIVFGSPAYPRNAAVSWVPSMASVPRFMAIDAPSMAMRLLAQGGMDAGVNGASWAVQSRPERWLLTGHTGWQQQPGPIRGARLGVFIGLLVVATLILQNVVCFGIGGQDVHAVRAFATTRASFDQRQSTPATHFGADDTPTAVVILDWPAGSSAGLWHRVNWVWSRGGQVVWRWRSCHLQFNQKPYTAWTWHIARTLGGGHYHVDMLIDGRQAASTEFDIDAAPAAQQGALVVPDTCG
jgi:hypothetical protein